MKELGHRSVAGFVLALLPPVALAATQEELLAIITWIMVGSFAALVFTVILAVYFGELPNEHGPNF
jgi:hypothetical protein